MTGNALNNGKEIARLEGNLRSMRAEGINLHALSAPTRQRL